MKCYRQGGCGPYEMLPCNECPASKPEYLEKVKTAKWVWDSSKWTWNPIVKKWTIGVWRCSNCQAINHSIEHSSKVNPLSYTNSKYCPNCGQKMIH